MNVAVLPDLIVNTSNDVTRNGEADSFAPAGLRKDESVDPDYVAIRVQQRPAAVTGINRRVSLDVDHRIIRLDLAPNRADDAETHRVLETQRIAKRQRDLPLAESV